MGLIKAGVGAVGGVLADQWKEFFYCEAMPKELLVTKGQKRVSGRWQIVKHKGQRQHHHKRLGYSRCGRTVHDDSRAGQGGRVLRGARRVYI